MTKDYISGSSTSTISNSTLDNGLEVLIESNQANSSAAIGFFVKTGARDETPKEAGVSHFLEHMMFKGTPTRTAIEINLELGELGAQANAFTSEEATVYYGAVTPDKVEPFLELLSDMLRPTLAQDDFNTEKNVILEEIALYEDRPQFFLFEKTLKDFFGAHPAGNSVLGTKESVGGLAQSEMSAYFGRRYTPDNMGFVAAGKVEREKLLTRVNDLTKSWTNNHLGDDHLGKDSKGNLDRRGLRPFVATTLEKEYKKPNLQQAHLALIGPGVPALAPERIEMALAAMIMGDSSGSRMYWELIDRGLCDGAGAEHDERMDAGCMVAYASTAPDKLDQVSKIMRRIWGEMAEVTDEELEQAKAKLCAKLVLRGELPMGRLMSIGLDWALRDTVENLDKLVQRVNDVSLGHIKSAITKSLQIAVSEFRLVPA